MYNIPHNIKELLGKNCSGKMNDFLKDMGLFEDIQKCNGEEIEKRMADNDNNKISSIAAFNSSFFIISKTKREVVVVSIE